MGAKSMIRRALALGGNNPGALPPRVPVTTPGATATVMASVIAEDELVRELRSMIDKGQGGARGMSAATRRDALRGMEVLAERDPEGVLSLARIATRGERSQGAAICNLVSWGRS